MSKGKIAAVIVMAVGLLLIAAVVFVFNPRQQTVYIAITDIQAGEKITPDKVKKVNVAMRNADLYLNPGNVAEYGFGVVTTSIPKGQYIPLSAIVAPGSAKAEDYRVALGLNDPNLVAFTIPVTPDNAPQHIQPGDIVDISIAVGSASFLTGKLENVPTPAVYTPYRSSVSVGVVPETNVTPSPTPLPTPTATPTPQNFALPVGKLIVPNLRVLSVRFEERPNPAYSTGTESGNVASPFIRGDIRSITVAIPSDQVEAMTFALASASQFHVLVHSPLYTPEPDKVRVYPGMSWDDFVAYFKAMRELWVVGETTSQYPVAGMSSLYPTLEATLHPATPTPTPTYTPTPTASANQVTPTPTP